jgi:hypothetical protein
LGLHHQGAAAQGIAPDFGEALAFAGDGAPQLIGHAAAQDFHRPAHRLFGGQVEELAGRHAEPAHHAMFVGGHHPGGQGVQQGFRHGFLAGDFFVEQGVFQGAGHVVGGQGHLFQIIGREGSPAGAAAQQEPAQDAAAGVQRGQHLGPRFIQHALEQPAFVGVAGLLQAQAGGHESVCFQPADKRMVSVVERARGLVQAVQAGDQAVAGLAADAGHQAGPGHSGGGGQGFHAALQHGLQVVKVAEHAGKMRKGRGVS